MGKFGPKNRVFAGFLFTIHITGKLSCESDKSLIQHRLISNPGKDSPGEMAFSGVGGWGSAADRAGAGPAFRRFCPIPVGARPAFDLFSRSDHLLRLCAGRMEFSASRAWILPSPHSKSPPPPMATAMVVRSVIANFIAIPKQSTPAFRPPPAKGCAGVRRLRGRPLERSPHRPRSRSSAG